MVSNIKINIYVFIFHSSDLSVSLFLREEDKLIDRLNKKIYRIYIDIHI